MVEKNNYVNRSVLLLLSFICLFSPLFSFLNIDLGFIILTPNRLALIVASIYCSIVWLIRMFKHEAKAIVLNNREEWFVVLFFVAWFLAGAIWLLLGKNEAFAKTEVISILTILLFAFCFFTLIQSLEDVKFISIAYVISGVVLSVLAGIEVVYGSFVPGTRYYLSLEEKVVLEQTLFAPTAVFFNQNDFAAYLLMCVNIIGFWLLQCNNNKSFFGCLIIGIILIVPTVIINSTIFEMSVCLLLILTFVLLCFIPKRDMKTRIIRIGVLLTTVILFCSVGTRVIKDTAYQLNMHHFSREIESLSEDSYKKIEELNLKVSDNPDTLLTQLYAADNGAGTITKRYWLIRAGMEFFLESPMVGNGPDSFREKIQNDVGYLQKTGGLINPHCYYTEMLSQYGGILFLIYLLIFLYCLILSLKKTYRGLKQGEVRMSLLCLMLFGSFSIAVLMSSSAIRFTTIWMFYVLAVALFTKQKKENQESLGVCL